MAKSTKPQDSQAGEGPTASDAADHPRRTGLARWRPYTAAVVAVGVIFAASAMIGAHVRSSGVGKITPPSGVPSADPYAIGVNPAVPVTLTVYEDLRSPASRVFAQQYQRTIDAMLNSGQTRVEYRFVTSTDKQYGGDGSAMAANAAACAQDAGKPQFVGFMNELWSHQPERRHDRFASEGYLDGLGRKVKGLSPATFAPCVHNKDHMGWVEASQRGYLAQGLGEVPVVRVNGQTIYPARDNLTPAKLEAIVWAEVRKAESPAPSLSPSPSPSHPTTAAAATSGSPR